MNNIFFTILCIIATVCFNFRMYYFIASDFKYSLIYQYADYILLSANEEYYS